MNGPFVPIVAFLLVLYHGGMVVDAFHLNLRKSHGAFRSSQIIPIKDNTIQAQRTVLRAGAAGGGSGGGGGGRRRPRRPAWRRWPPLCESSAPPVNPLEAAKGLAFPRGGGAGGHWGLWERVKSAAGPWSSGGGAADDDEGAAAAAAGEERGGGAAAAAGPHPGAGASSPELRRVHRELAKLRATYGWAWTEGARAHREALARGRLLPAVSYLGPEGLALCLAALELAYHAHDGQRRKSGEPYIEHPVAVAAELGRLRADRAAVLAGLLHDTVEDTPLTVEDLGAVFGAEVAEIVRGDTKVSKLIERGATRAAVAAARGLAAAGARGARDDEEGPFPDEAAENLRCLLLAMARDRRVVLVKLADRLHNMRTLGAMPAHKQARIARETRAIYVPLAHRLGVWGVKAELEDLCFGVLQPAERAAVARATERFFEGTFEELGGAGSRAAAAAAADADDRGAGAAAGAGGGRGGRLRALEAEGRRLRAFLGEAAAAGGRAANIRVDVVQHTPYELWKRHRRTEGQDKPLPESIDPNYLRILFKAKPPPGPPGDPAAAAAAENGEADKEACYCLLEAVHTLLEPTDPPQVKDYVAFPKANGYRALHTAVRLPLPPPAAAAARAPPPTEIQIRTYGMERVAQYGLAASWAAPPREEEEEGAHRAADGGREAGEEGGGGGNAGAGAPAAPYLVELPWLELARTAAMERLGTGRSVTGQAYAEAVRDQLVLRAGTRFYPTALPPEERKGGNATSAEVGVRVAAAAAATGPAAGAGAGTEGAGAAATTAAAAVAPQLRPGEAVVAVKVNGRPAPLDRPVGPGDVVSAVTAAVGPAPTPAAQGGGISPGAAAAGAAPAVRVCVVGEGAQGGSPLSPSGGGSGEAGEPGAVGPRRRRLGGVAEGAGPSLPASRPIATGVPKRKAGWLSQGADLDWYKLAELKHGRLAMVISVFLLVPEIWDYLIAKLQNIPPTPFLPYYSYTGAQISQVLVLAGIAEFVTKVLLSMRTQGRIITDPGARPPPPAAAAAGRRRGEGARRRSGGLRVLSAEEEARRRRLLGAEVANGRLAMAGVACMLLQAALEPQHLAAAAYWNPFLM